MPNWHRHLLSAGRCGSPLSGLLVLSQVILSLQLPFAVIPLVTFTGDRLKMGHLVSPRWLTWTAWLMTALIIVLNLKVISDSVRVFLA